MEPPASSAADEDEEWELCNDDGFIYRRKKRRLTDQVPAASAVDDAIHRHEEEKRRRERKRRTLLKLLERHQREIGQWELLSNSLSAMQEASKQFECRKLRPQQQEEEEEDSIPVVVSKDSKENQYKCLVDEMLSQAEAQEGIIRNVTNLCNIAESLCDVQEEQIKQSYFDLPVWSSPGELMASLCDQ